MLRQVSGSGHNLLVFQTFLLLLKVIARDTGFGGGACQPY